MPIPSAPSRPPSSPKGGIVAIPVTVPFELPVPFRTARLTLRSLSDADVGDVHAYQSREDVCRYIPFEPRTRDEVAAKLPERLASRPLMADDDAWQIGVELDGRVIGDVFLALRSLEHAGGEIGWSLHPDHEGRGYMTEAASAVLGLAFRGLGLHRVMARLDPRNAPSAALCRRLGMRLEASFREDTWFKGEWGDTDVYALLAREWANGGSAAA